MFGKSVLSTYRVVEGHILGLGLTNRPQDEKFRTFYKKYIHTLEEYLETNSKESREFLELCNHHVDDLANNNLTFLD